MRKQVLAAYLVLCIVTATLSGCSGGNTAPTQEQTEAAAPTEAEEGTGQADSDEPEPAEEGTEAESTGAESEDESVTGLLSAAETPEDMVVADRTYGWVLEDAAVGEDGSVSVKLMPAGGTEPQIFITDVKYGVTNAMTGASGADVAAQRNLAGSFSEVCFNAAGEVIDIHRVLKEGLNFDTAKFGGDLTAVGSTVEYRGLDYTDIYNNDETGTTGMYTGLSGEMVANGWILELDAASGTITIGDGNRETDVFNETYTIAEDVAVYRVDNDGSFESEEITLDELAVSTLDADGYIYDTPSEERIQVIVIFDGDYTEYGSASVREIYQFTAQTDVSDFVGNVPQSVRIKSDLSLPSQGSPSPNKAPYLLASNPITVVEGKMWTIGDIEDNCPVFKGASDKDMGKSGDGDWLVQFDAGWVRDGYQYMRNIEKVGLDPRDLDMLLIPHGHGDHYGAAYDEWEMVVRAGGSLIVYESYEDTIGFDIHGFPEIGGIYDDAPVRSIITNWYPNDEWVDLGDGLSMIVTLTPGHTQGTGSCVFQVTVGEGGMKDAKLTYELNESTGEYETSYSDYNEGDELFFAYMGGYGINGLADPAVGFRRANFVASLRYIESVFSNLKTTTGGVADGVYNLAQHTNQYPYTETAAIMARYNEDNGTDYPFLHFMREGREEVINFCEKRASALIYKDYTDAYIADYEANGDTSPFYDYDGVSVKTDITSTDIKGNTLEEMGPFKHEGGEVTIQIDEDIDILVMHGYDIYLNKGLVAEGMYYATSADIGIADQNFDISRGFAFAKDGFVYDPDVWYVQIGAHVFDDYDGNVYSGEGPNEGLEFVSGPVESLHGEGWSEIIRTGGMTKEEAYALAGTLENGAYYKVNIKKTGDIINAEDVMETFVKTEQ